MYRYLVSYAGSSSRNLSVTTALWPVPCEPSERLCPVVQTDTQAVEYNNKIRNLWSDWTSRSAGKGDGVQDSAAAAAPAAPSAAETIAAARGSPPQQQQVCRVGMI